MMNKFSMKEFITIAKDNIEPINYEYYDLYTVLKETSTGKLLVRPPQVN